MLCNNCGKAEAKHTAVMTFGLHLQPIQERGDSEPAQWQICDQCTAAQEPAKDRLMFTVIGPLDWRASA